MVYIYVLIDPRIAGDLSVRYVGKSINPARRFKSHLKDKSEIRKARWIRELSRSSLEPTLVVIEEVTDETKWEEAECRVIKHYRDLGCDLTNLTDGGDGVHNPSKESREKLSNTRKRMWADPVIREKLSLQYTEERNAAVSRGLTGKAKSAEHVSKLPQNQKGFKPNISQSVRQSRSEIAKKVNAERVYKPHSTQTKEKIAEKVRGNKSRTGLKNSPEMNQKISAFQKGRPKSKEQKEKMRQAALLRWSKHREASK